MNFELGPQAIGWVVQTGLVALVGFLLRRAITSLDDQLRNINAKLGALDLTDREQAREILELKIQAKYLNEELHGTKDQLARMSERHEEFGKFLSRIGFQRAGNKMPEEGA